MRNANREMMSRWPPQCTVRLRKAKGHLQPRSSFGWSSAAVEGGSSLCQGGASKDGDRDPREKPQTARANDVARDGSRSGCAGVPADGSPHYDQRTGVFTGILEPLTSIREGIVKVTNRNSLRFDLAGQYLLRELDCAGGGGSHRGPPTRAPFRFHLHRLSGTVPYELAAAGLDDLVSCHMRHSGCQST